MKNTGALLALVGCLFPNADALADEVVTFVNETSAEILNVEVAAFDTGELGAPQSTAGRSGKGLEATLDVTIAPSATSSEHVLLEPGEEHATTAIVKSETCITDVVVDMADGQKRPVGQLDMCGIDKMVVEAVVPAEVGTQFTK